LNLLILSTGAALLRDNVPLKVDAHVHRLVVLHGLPAPYAGIIFLQMDTLLKPLLSIRDLAWPSVKLFAPATGAVGLGGVFGVLTAGVLASWFAGFMLVSAIAGMAEATNKTAFADREQGLQECIPSEER
jgi:hypothetical protein